jgi:hypothetical protein
MSSRYTTKKELLKGCKMSSINLIKVVEAFVKPKGMINHSKIPSLDLKVIFHTSSYSDYSTLVREPNPEPASSNQPTQIYIPYHHPHHKSQRNGNHCFISLQKRCERHNCGPVSTTRIDFGWIDGWSWNHLTRCLRTSYRCVSSVV